MERIARWGDYDSPFVRQRYNRLAKFFILFEWLFLPPRGIRRKAVNRLELKPGGCVLEVGLRDWQESCPLGSSRRGARARLRRGFIRRDVTGGRRAVCKSWVG